MLLFSKAIKKRGKSPDALTKATHSATFADTILSGVKSLYTHIFTYFQSKYGIHFFVKGVV